jgi:hypothetical protein
MKFRLNKLLLFMIGVFYLLSITIVSYSQEAEKTEDKAIDLPPVKIDIVDSTQLVIPKEKFDGLTRPDVDMYITLTQKERLWYLPSVTSPERVQKKAISPEDDFVFILSAYPGLPAALAYQALLVKGFGNSQILLDLGKSSLSSQRAAKLDKQKKMDGLMVDKLDGLFAFQTDKTNLRTGLNYKAKDLNYLDIGGGKYTNDRSLFSISADWNQIYINDIESNFSAEVSRMGMEGPLPTDSNEAIDIKTDFSLRAYLMPSTPINAGLKIEHFYISVITASSYIRLYLGSGLNWHLIHTKTHLIQRAGKLRYIQIHTFY